MRRKERPGRTQLFASAGVHVVAVVVAWSAQVSHPDPNAFETFQVTLVSPPPSQVAPEPEPVVREEVVVETPEPPPVEKPPPVVEETPRVEQKPTPTPTPTPPPPEPEPVEAGTPEPSETVSGEDLNIRMEGLRRDFPEYYGNIIRQIQRCFEYRGEGRLETSVIFYISRDGRVDGGSIDFYQRSGNVNFDYAAMGAVECAGAGRFGPLPEDLGLDRLPILFTFTPRREDGPRPAPGASPGPEVPSNPAGG
jgi:outer membrane biosynthesis protein TonB